VGIYLLRSFRFHDILLLNLTDTFGVMNAPKINYLHVMGFLASTHFMIHVYTQLVPAILPTVKLELGITLFQASLLLSIPMIVQVLGYIPVGIISDRAGSEVILISFLVTLIESKLDEGLFVTCRQSHLPPN